MTTKIPVTTSSSWKGVAWTPAWRKFCVSLIIPNSTVLHKETDLIKEALKEYDAVWLRGEHMIEFASEEQAVLWVLRWS